MTGLPSFAQVTLGAGWPGGGVHARLARPPFTTHPSMGSSTKAPFRSKHTYMAYLYRFKLGILIHCTYRIRHCILIHCILHTTAYRIRYGIFIQMYCMYVYARYCTLLQMYRSLIQCVTYSGSDITLFFYRFRYGTLVKDQTSHT